MKPDQSEVNLQLVAALSTARKRLPAEDQWAADVLESYCAVAMRIIAKTNPSKVRAETQHVWIQGLMPVGEKK